MKKFTFKNVLDGFRSSVTANNSANPSSTGIGPDQRNPQNEIVENLRVDNFNVAKTFCHGFPFQPTAIAFDPILKLLAIGTQSGNLRILGRPGVDIHFSITNPTAILHLEFLVNEGKLVSATADDVLSLWNFRENSKPEIIHSLKFQRERITVLRIPLQSKWIYVGTERGNVHVVNVDTCQLSGYIINWNKSIEISRKTHPGPVIYLGDNPTDPSKLLIGYSELLVLWDLRLKTAEIRFQCNEPLRSVAWHSNGKDFVSSHSDGSLLTWNTRGVTNKPVNVSFPHARGSKDGKPETFKPITKVDWKSSRTGDNFVIFTGGGPTEHGNTPTLTVIHGKTTTVLEMEHNVLDFVVMCESQWESEIQDPTGIIVLLQSDLVVIDLLTPGYPSYPNPYPMDIHESPVTTCTYIANCPGDLIPALYSTGSKVNKKAGGYSDRDWPIDGGTWGSSSCSYAEIVVTGHADGSVKFWDGSSTSLQHLYKLKTSKAFERQQSKKIDESDPYAVQVIKVCPESRLLLVAGASSQVLLFKFRKHENTSEIAVLEIPIVNELVEDEFGGFDYNCRVDRDKLEFFSPLRVKTGPIKKTPGYQIELVCLTPWINGEPPGGICSLAISSGCGLLGYGTETGVVIVDYIQQVCLMSNATPDLYGTADPYTRAPKSPSSLKRDESPPEMQDPPMSPTSSANASTLARSQDSGGGGGGGSIANKSPRKQSEPRRSKSQGSSAVSQPHLQHQQRREQRSLSKCYSMAQQGTASANFNSSSPESTPSSPGLTNPVKSNILLLSRQYYSSVGGGNSSSTSSPQTGGSSYVTCGSGSGQHSTTTNQDKLDSTFSRSRSSSMTSLDNISQESIQCLTFVETFPKKNDSTLQLTCWVGTSLGSILVLNITSSGDRRTDPLNVSPSGTIFRLKGSILDMSFMDASGCILSMTAESWKDDSRAKTPTKTSSRGSPTDSSYAASNNLHYAILVSEKQSRVVSLPSQTCVYKAQLVNTNNLAGEQISASTSSVPSSSTTTTTTTSAANNYFVIKAGVTTLRDSPCLVTYNSNGRLSVYSLPSLRQLIDTDFVPLSDLRIAKTFCLSEFGHGLYLSSPSEVQKFTISTDFTHIMDSLLGSLFIETEFPEKPKEGFFTGLFGGGVRNLDREELFGEASGKPPRAVAKVIAGPNSPALEHLSMRQSTAASEISRARMLLVERGEKLGRLEDKTEKMMNDAENFSSAAHQLMLKYKDKKWYQL